MDDTIAIYVRVSSEEQVKGFSIDAQLEALRTYANQQQLTIYKEYIDAGYSGKSIEGRPAMQELLQDAKKGCFQCVVSWKLNRIARNLLDLLSMLEVFKENQISYLSLTEQLRADTEQEKFALQMIGAVAQLEREQIGENVRLSVQERNRQGRWNCGNLVLGYEWIKCSNPQDSYLQVVPEEAEIVRFIFKKYRSGLGFKAITNLLNAAGHRTKRNKVFNINSVRGILTNVNYIGKIRYTVNNTVHVTHSNLKKQIVDGKHEAIIEKALWDEVQRLLARRSLPSMKTIQRAYPLTGLLKCPQCGGSMVACNVKSMRKDGSYRFTHYYVCGNYTNKGSSVCKANAIPAQLAESHTFYRLRKLLNEKNWLNQITSRVQQKQKKAYQPLYKELKRINCELKELVKRKKRCFELFEEGLLEQNILIQKIEDYGDKEKELEITKQSLEKKIDTIKETSLNLNDIQKAFTLLITSLQTIDDPNRKILLRSFIHSIHVPPSRNLLEMKIKGTNALHNLII